MSFSPNYFSSKVNKECTKRDIYYTSLDSKRPVRKTMAAPIIRLAPKGEVKVKRLLPKPGYPNNDSMSLKNVKSKQLILQQACQTAKTPCIRLEKKTDIRTASHDKSNLTNLIPVIAKRAKLPHKPKYSIITEAQAISQSQALVADAELMLCPNTTPARHQLAYNTALDNEKIIPGNNAKINEVYCTNTSNISNTSNTNNTRNTSKSTSKSSASLVPF